MSPVALQQPLRGEDIVVRVHREFGAPRGAHPRLGGLVEHHVNLGKRIQVGRCQIELDQLERRVPD